MSNKIGALWKSESQNEKAPEFNGEIEIIKGMPQRISVFKNEKKTENQPDYQIVLSPPMSEKKTNQN